MRTTEEICQGIRTQKVLTHILPLGYSRSVPIPGIVNGMPALSFLFFRAEGPRGQPKNIHAPVARVIVDKQTANLMEITLAPAVWLPGHDAGTVLGQFPPQGLAGLTVQAADEQYRQYYHFTDQLLEQSADAGDLLASPLWSEWKAAFQRVHEEALLPYFTAAGLPDDAVVGLSAGSETPPSSPASAALPPAEPDRTCPQDIAPPATRVNEPPSATAVPPRLSGAIAKVAAPEQVRRWMAEILALMDRARTLLRAGQQDTLLEQWQRISRMLDSPVFMVAVVGEFSRGKSRLINRLLGESVLPEGDLPTTAMLTRVMAGDAAKLTHILPDRSRRDLPLNSQTLEQFSTEAHGQDPAGVLEVHLPNAWLKQSGIAMIDTPGAGDLAGHRAGLVCEAIANCEATLIAVSAMSPLSLTEKAFIEEHIFSRKIPKVAIVITRLDQVNEKDREKVVQYVLDKVRAWKYQVEVWCAHGELALTPDVPLSVKGPDQIVRALERWVQDPWRTQQRLGQMATQLADLLGVLRSATVAKRQVLEAGESTRKEVIARAKLLLENERIEWEDLRLEVERRGNSAEDWLQQTVADATPNLFQRLQFELNRVPDPREWWLKELPYRLSQELRGMSRALSGTLAERLKGDATWLVATVRQAFSVQLAPEVHTPAVELGEDPSLPLREELIDLNRYRITTRILSLVAVAGGYVGGYLTLGPLFGSVGALVSGLGGLAAQGAVNRKVQEQRDVLAKALDDGLHAVLHEAQRVGRENVRQAYQRLLVETRERESAWHRSRLAAIASSTPEPGADSSKVVETLKYVDSLIQDIRTIHAEF